MFDQVSSLPVPLLEWSLCSFLLQESPSLWQPNVHLVIILTGNMYTITFQWSPSVVLCGRAEIWRFLLQLLRVLWLPTMVDPRCPGNVKNVACNTRLAILTWIEARPSSMKCTAGELATFFMLCTIFMSCKRKSLLYLQNNRVKGRYRSDMVMLG